jgi:hypothetical protein
MRINTNGDSWTDNFHEDDEEDSLIIDDTNEF